MKNMKKWLSLLLTCVLLIGTFVIVPISANEVTSDATVEIVANNVYYADAYYLMYAVDAQNLADGETVQMIICDANGEEIYGTATQNGTVNYGGATCLKFVSDKGIPAQNIATTVYAQAQVVNANDEVVAKSAIQAYSVMEFIYEVQLKGLAGADDITLYNALIDYATVAQSIMVPDASVKIGDVSYSYVKVVNGTIDGTNTDMMVNTTAGAVEGLLANLTATIEIPEGMNLAWDVTTTPLNGNESTIQVGEDAAKEYAIPASVAVTLKAVAVEGDVPEVLPETRTWGGDWGTANNQYAKRESADGWIATNAQLNDFTPAGYVVPVLNGKTSKKGVLTSTTLTDGIQTLTLSVGLPSKDTKGVSLLVEIVQNGKVVATTTLTSNVQHSYKQGPYSDTLTWENINVKGDFTIRITNASPSNSSSDNKDRTAIWDVTWVTNP